MAASREEIALGARNGNFYTALALDAVREPILLVDGQDSRFNIIMANAASRRLLHHQHVLLLGASALDFLEFASREPFQEAIGRLQGGSAVESRQISWLGPDFDGDCATEFKLLADPASGNTVMLTLPSIDAASRRFREISETQQLSQFLADGEGMPKIGGWEQSADSERLTWTDGMYRLFEADPAEFVPTTHSIRRIFSPAGIEAAFGPRPGVGLTNAAVDCQCEATTCTGRKIWVHMIGQLELRDGRVVRSHGAVQDITAQRNAHRTLARITDWLKLSMRAAHMYAWRWERQADQFELVLPEDLARYVPPDFRGLQGFFARVHPDDFDRVSRSVQLSIDEGVEFKEEFRFRMTNELYRWYASVGRPMLDDAGAVIGLVGATQDVTNRRTTQARVREYGELLRTATANTTDVLLLLDSDLRVRFCNRSMRGVAPQAMMGLPAERVMDSCGWAEHRAQLNTVLTTGSPASFSCEAIGEDGDTHRYENRAIPVYDKGQISGVSVTITDITERMRLEREILEISTREQERIGQDLHDGLGQELTGIALMLRSLSTKIRRDYPNASDDVDDIIAVVNRSIETARSLARGLSPLNSERGGLVHALRSLAARSREIYGLNVRFRSKIWPQLTLDETRCSHLYRIAQEALTNIARHAQASRADIRLQVADNKFTLAISDDGVGLDRSFKSINGMGLKLMAYRAGMIGGKLEIAPNEPKGTIVRISGEQPPLM